MEHKAESIDLTSAEIAYLWNSYILNSKSKHILIHAVEKAEDGDIKAVLEDAANLSVKLLEGIEEIYRSVNHPIPYAFKEDDIRLDADKLFSDALILLNIKQMTTFGLSNYGLTLCLSARADVRKLFNMGVMETVELMNKVDELALSKGIFVRTPYIPIPKTIEFAQSQSIMGAFIGNKRPLTSMEIACVFASSQFCSVTEALITGLAQTRNLERVKDYLVRGRRLLKEHIEAFNNVLCKEDLNVPPTYETEIYNTNDSPYSDKIALYALFGTAAEILDMYSAGKLGSIRKDIVLLFTQLSAEISMYLKDGIDIAIDNGWMEEMPKGIDRGDLIESKDKN